MSILSRDFTNSFTGPLDTKCATKWSKRVNIVKCGLNVRFWILRYRTKRFMETSLEQQVFVSRHRQWKYSAGKLVRNPTLFLGHRLRFSVLLAANCGCLKLAPSQWSSLRVLWGLGDMSAKHALSLVAVIYMYRLEWVTIVAFVFCHYVLSVWQL